MPGFLVDDAPVRGIYKPPSAGFTGGVVDLLDRSKVGLMDLSDLAKAQIQYGNRDFIEANKADRTALQVEWETVHRDTGFGEFIADGFGNLAAGFINAVVPGSNIGDERNPSNLAGSVLGSVSSFLMPTGFVQAAVNKMDMSFNLGGALNFINKTLASPLGSLTSSLLFNPTTPQAQQAAFSAPAVQNVAEMKSSPAQAAVFGGTPGQQFLPGVTGTASIGSKTSVPMWAWVWVAGAIAVLVGLFFIFKRKR